MFSHFLPDTFPKSAAPPSIISAPNPGSQGIFPTPTNTPIVIAIATDLMAAGQLFRDDKSNNRYYHCDYLKPPFPNFFTNHF